MIACPVLISASTIETEHGTVQLEADGSFTYFPEDNYTGPETFTYTATNAATGETATATVTVTVENVAPAVAITGLPGAEVPKNVPVTLGSSVIDPGVGETFTYSWDVTKVAGGTTTEHFATGTAADFTFTPNEEGDYTVQLVVTDAAGDTGAVQAVIYDPDPVTLYWDPDGVSDDNNVDGTHLGGSGSWLDPNDPNKKNWWCAATGTRYSQPAAADTVVFIGNSYGSGTPTVTISGSNTVAPAIIQISTDNYLIQASGEGTLALSGTTQIAVTSGTATISSAITNSATPRSITKSGGGTLALTNSSNSYTGGTTISGGVLNYVDGALGSSGGISFAGGTLQWASDLPVDNISSRFAAVPSGTTAKLDTNGKNVTLGSLPGSSGSLQKSGSGTLTLIGNVYFSSGIALNGGTLSIGDGTTTTYLYGSITNNAILTFNTNNSGQSYSGVISGYGSMTKSGSGTLTLTGTNTCSGTTTVSQGTLRLGDGYTNGSIGGSIVNNSALCFNNGSNQTFSGGISGSGTITKSGGGTLTLLGSNSASNTTISVGTLQVGSGGSYGGLSSNVANSGCLYFYYDYGQTYSYTISGTGSLTKYGPGTLTLTGVNTYTGSTTVTASSGGGLQVTKSTTDDPLLTSSISLSGATLTCTVNAGLEWIYDGSISGSSSGALTKNGAGKLALGGASTYSGGTNISGGILQLGNGSTNGSVTGSIVNTAELCFNNGSNQTFSGGISGSGTITKSGGGTLTLLGSNSAGNTTISSGTLQIGSGGYYGSLSSNVANSGCLYFYYDYGQTYSYTISGTGSVAKYGSGLLTLSGVNTYTGSTTVTGSGGGLQVTMSTGQAPLATSSISVGYGNAFNCTVNTGLEWAYNGSINGGVLTKYGPGTLTLGGATSLSGGVVSAGTLKLGNTFSAGSLTVYGTLDLNGQTVCAGSLSGSGTIKDDSFNSSTTALTVNMASGSSSTFSGAIQDGINGQHVAVTKSGAGVLTLSGGNTFTGGTTISGGTLKTGNSSSLGTGAVTMTSGTLDLNASNLTTGSLSGTGGNIIDSGGSGGGGIVTLTVNQTADATYSGTIQNGYYRSVALMKSGGSAPTLTGNNTFSGGTTINEGTLAISADAALGAVPASPATNLTFAAAGVLQASGGFTLNANRRISIASGATATIDTQAYNVTVAGAVTGNGGLDKLGAGTLTLSGNNTYTGSTTINAGVLRFNSAGAVGGSGASVTIGSTSVAAAGFTINDDDFLNRINGNSIGVVALAVDSDQDLHFTSLEHVSLGAVGNCEYTGTLTPCGSTYLLGGGGGTLTLSHANTLTGGNGLVVGGASGGTVALTANNNYIGSTTLSSGTLSVVADGCLGTSNLGADDLIFSGGRLQIVGGSSFASGKAISLRTSSTIEVTNTEGATLSGVISDSDALIKSGVGSLTLSASNTYEGGTTISEGTLRTGNVSSLGTGAVTINSGCTLDLNGSGLAIGRLSGSGNIIDSGGGGGTSTLTVNQTADAPYSGTIQNGYYRSVALAKSGSGTLTLSGNNTYSGGTTINEGTLAVAANSNLGSGGSLAFGGGTLQITAASAFSSNRTVTLNAVGGTVDVTNGGAVAEFTSAIGGQGGLAKTGAGTLTLGGGNDYQGGTTVHDGRLGGVLPSGRDVALLEGAVLDLSDSDATIGNLSGWGVIDKTYNSAKTLSVASGDFSGSIANTLGTLALNKTGSGTTLTLRGSNTYSGSTTVSAGVLAVTGSLSNSVVTVSGGTLAGTGTISQDITVSTGGSLAPGNGGVLTTHDLALASGSHFVVEVNGSTPGTGYDKVQVTGTVNLGDATLVPSGTCAGSNGEAVVLIQNDGSDAVGAFAGLAEGSPVAVNGVAYHITYVYNAEYSSGMGQRGTGNDVALLPDATILAAPSPLTDGSLIVPFGPLGIEYISSADRVRPIISVDARLQPEKDNADLETVAVTLTLGGITVGPVYYDGSGATAANLYRFAIPVNADALETGRYDWHMTITQNYEWGAPLEATYYGQEDIVNLSGSPYGVGWNFVGLDRLVKQSDDVLLVRGDGSTAFFWHDGQGGYDSEPGDSRFDQLSDDGSGGFTLATTDGTRHAFNAQGFLTSRTDRVGNTTSYAYTDGDSDGHADDISRVTDPAGRETDFGYSGGRLSNVTDLAGRVTYLAYDAAGRLTSVRLPDPEGSTSLIGPLTQFGYDPTSGLLDSVTDAVGKTTDFTYDTGGSLVITRPDSTSDSYLSIQVAALPGTPAALKPASDVVARYVDQDSEETTYAFDRFGNATRITSPDPDGPGGLPAPVTTFQRDTYGRVVTMTEPDPDGPTGSQPAPVTQYYYYGDATFGGNLKDVFLPDGTETTNGRTVMRWTYGTYTVGGKTFYQVASYQFKNDVDFDNEEPGTYDYTFDYLTKYDIDTANGNVIRTRQIVGTEDPLNSIVNDIVTSFTYTDITGGSKGLLDTVTDPLNHVTSYVYGLDSGDFPLFDRLIQVHYADGTADEAMVQYEYDLAGNVFDVTDEMTQHTYYTYDNLDRLTRVKLPDPDSTGSGLPAPVTRYVYDAASRPVMTIDPAGRTTETVYDDLGRVEKTYRGLRIDDNADGDPAGSFSHTGANWENITTAGYEGDYHTVTGAEHSATWTFNGLTAGQEYDVYATWTATGGAQSAQFTVINVEQTFDPDVDQSAVPQSGGGNRVVGDRVWELLAGQVTAQGTSIVVTLNSVANAAVFADAVYVVEHSPAAQYDYNDDGTVNSTTDARGKVTHYGYDPLDRLISATLPDPDDLPGDNGPLQSPVVTYSYDNLDRILSQSEPSHAGGEHYVTRYAYADFGRQVTVTLPSPVEYLIDDSTTEPATAFDTTGNWTSQTDSTAEQGGYLTDTPNSSGDTAVWSFTGLTPDRTYEVFVTWRADETLNSDSAFFDFDRGTPLCATVDQRESPESDSTAFSKQFEDDGPYYRRLQTFTAPAAGTHTVTLSDISSQTGKRIVADAVRVVEAGPATAYEYDGAGNLWKTTDALGHATTFSFDEYLGRPKQILGNDPDGPNGSAQALCSGRSTTRSATFSPTPTCSATSPTTPMTPATAWRRPRCPTRARAITAGPSTNTATTTRAT